MDDDNSKNSATITKTTNNQSSTAHAVKQSRLRGKVKGMDNNNSKNSATITKTTNNQSNTAHAVKQSRLRGMVEEWMITTVRIML